jgi:glycosyltransferase 2 family protein
MIESSSNRKLKSWSKHLIGACATVVCLAVVARQINLHEVLETIRHFHWPFLILGVASLALGYVLRIFRWSMMLRAAGTGTASFSNCAAPFLGSIALNNVLPLRLGDLVRALVFPKAMGISRIIATSSLVMERLVDLMTLLASLAIGLFAIQAVSIPPAIKDSAVTLTFLGGTALAGGFLFSGTLARYFNRLSSRRRSEDGIDRIGQVYETIGGLFAGFQAMSRPLVLLALLLISMLIWTCESGLFYFALLGLDMPATPPMALLVMSLATLATLAPSSPGYIGPFHLAAFTAISLMGGTSAQAGSYAVLVHLALWLPTTVAGAIAITFRPQLFRAAREQAA